MKLPMRTSMALTVSLLLGTAGFAQPADTPLPDAGTIELANAFVGAYLERVPEIGTFYGLPMAQHDRALDNSPESRRAWNARIDELHAAFSRIDASELEGPVWVAHGFLRQALDVEIGRRVCRAELWAVDQMNGLQVILPVLASRQPVGSEEFRHAALTRFAHYPAVIDQEIETLRQGLAEGYSAPRVSVERVIGQLDGLLSLPPKQSPLANPARRDDDTAFSEAFRELTETGINPALNRYRTFLREEYLPAARTTYGIDAIPAGDACYRALVLDNTTLPLTADEVHAIGLETMAGIHDEMRIIGERSFDTADVPALLERLRTDPDLRFNSADEIVATAQAAVDRSRLVMGDFFGRLPQADVVIEPFPDFEAPSAPPAQYFPPAMDGSRPGVYRINLHEPEQQPRADIEAVAFHEAIPGHHLQIALSLEQPGAHPITQLFQATAFVEGWGLYSERLADEMNLYTGDLDRLGMLSAASWRAARLVVDTGLHAKGWDRQQAVDYMRHNTAAGGNVIQTEVDRYIIMPGQALAYMIGYREITRLRTEAEQALGERFDIRAFHDEVLGDGGVTLPMLQEKVARWVAAQH